MKAKNTIIPVGLLVMALSASGQFVEAGQRDSHGRDRNGRESQGQSRERGDGSSERSRRDGNAQAAPPSQQRESPPPSARRGDDGQQRNATPPERSGDNRARGNYEQRDRDGARGSYGQAVPRRGGQVPPTYDRDRDDRNRDRRETFRYQPYRDRGYRDYRPYDYGYRGSPRLIPGRPLPRHYYGSGGSFSVYFGLGSGFLYGSPYRGRVYGYTAPYAYGSRIYYGDVRLEVRPRNAAVYVDGYYAGVVDDFDGVFQRLTLEVGPHEIEVSAPGLEPLLYDVYVDPTRTVTIRADLYPY